MPAPTPEKVMPTGEGFVSRGKIQGVTKGPKLTNEDVHVWGSAADDHGNDEQSRATEGDITSTDQVGDTPDKGANGSQSDKVGQDEPDPTVDTAQVSIDVRRNTTEDIDGDLRTSPQESLCDEGESSLAGHLPRWVRR